MIYLTATSLRVVKPEKREEITRSLDMEKVASHVEDLGKGVPTAQRKRGLLRLVCLS